MPVSLLGAGHFFGEGCLNGHPLRVTTATAIDECLITRIAREAMIATMRDEPKFSELFMADLLNRNGRIEEDLIDQLFNSSEKRARVRIMPHIMPNPMPRSLVDDPAHWSFRAKEMRALAAQMKDEETKTIMLRLGSDYDRLAERARSEQVARFGPLSWRPLSL